MMRVLLVGFIALVVVAVTATIMLSGSDSAVLSASPAELSLETVAEVATAEDAISGEHAMSNRDAAERAALRAVAMNGELVTAGHFSRNDLVQSIATPELADSLLADTSAQVLGFQFEVNTSSDFEMVQAPVTSRVVEVDSGRIEVTVWSVVIIASAEFGVGRELWQTSRLEMAEVDGTWLVDVWETGHGPAPAPSADLVFAGPGELMAPMSWPAVTDADVG